ncbi:MAG TPA: bifunctional precorrin-2 dehydrogenase/sirohydrochlorin ferrochelatase [Ktedonobacteraceae bacterium]
MPKYYPVMLDVRGRKAIVVGGDKISAEKAASLAASGAHVSVLSPTFCYELLQQAEAGQVTLWRKAYEPGDLADAFVVVAVASSPELVEAIWAETQQRGQLVNIVDVPAYCTFILPSILRREQLTVAVSTEGASPGLAKRIRQELEAYFPTAYGPYLRLAALARSMLRNRGVSYEQRDAFFADFFASDVLAQLVKGNSAEAIAITADLLQRYGVTAEVGTLKKSFEDETEKEYSYRGV